MRFESKYITMLEDLLRPEHNADRCSCPGCQATIRRGSRFCYHCQQFVDLNAGRVLDEPEVDGEMIEDLFLAAEQAGARSDEIRNSKRSRRAVRLVVAGFILAFTVILSVIGFGLIVAGLLMLLTGEHAPRETLSEDQRHRVLIRYLVPKVLREDLDEVEVFDHYKRVPSKLVHDAKLSDSPDQSISGEDFIRGISAGVPLQLSRLEVRRPEDGDAGRLFSGTLLATDPATAPGEAITIRSRLDCPEEASEVTTGIPEFDRRFCVRAEHPAAAAGVLSAALVERILDLDRVCRDPFVIRFLANGRVCISVANEETIFGQDNTVRQTEQMRRQIRRGLSLSPQLLALVHEAASCVRER